MEDIIEIWKAGLKYLEGRNIGLDGVVSQQDNYKKASFKLAYRNIRYEGISGGDTLKNEDIVKLSSLDFHAIDLYDNACFPTNRREFLKSWIREEESNAFGIMKDKKLSGYGVIRKCLAGYKIGPLFADDSKLAESLFIALKTSVEPSKSIYLDTPEVNKEALALAKRHNMKVVFETARMYTKEEPDIELNHIFGVTSFELG